MPITILTILILQLQNFSHMFMVFLTAPLGLIGVACANGRLAHRGKDDVCIAVRGSVPLRPDFR